MPDPITQCPVVLAGPLVEGASQPEAGHVCSSGAAVSTGRRDPGQAAGPGGAPQSQSNQHLPREVRSQPSNTEMMEYYL